MESPDYRRPDRGIDSSAHTLEWLFHLANRDFWGLPEWWVMGDFTFRNYALRGHGLHHIIHYPEDETELGGEG